MELSNSSFCENFLIHDNLSINIHLIKYFYSILILSTRKCANLILNDKFRKKLAFYNKRITLIFLEKIVNHPPLCFSFRTT